MPTLGIKACNNKRDQIISQILLLFSKRDYFYHILDSVVPHRLLQSYRDRLLGKLFVTSLLHNVYCAKEEGEWIAFVLLNPSVCKQSKAIRKT